MSLIAGKRSWVALAATINDFLGVRCKDGRGNRPNQDRFEILDRPQPVGDIGLTQVQPRGVWEFRKQPKEVLLPVKLKISLWPGMLIEPIESRFTPSCNLGLQCLRLRLPCILVNFAHVDLARWALAEVPIFGPKFSDCRG